MTLKSEAGIYLVVGAASIASLFFGFSAQVAAQDFQASASNSQNIDVADQLATQQADALQQSMFKPLRMPQTQSNFGALGSSQPQSDQSQQIDLDKPKEPWQMTGRIHVEQGTNQGYLVLQVDLAKGHYIYSVTPGQSPAPTAIEATPSSMFRLLSGFSPDTAPQVIEKDPVFQQRIEKHKGTVQFFAPIQIQPGSDPSQLNAEVVFIGQVCSEEGFCTPLRDKKIMANFAGFFERTPQQQSQPSQQTASPQSQSTGLRR